MSGVSHVAEETRHTHGIAEAAISEAKSMHGEVESRVALLVAQAKASTTHIADVLSKLMSKVAADTQAKTSRAVGTIAQQLEREIEAAAVSTTVMSEQRMRSAVDGLHAEIRTQISQNRADFERR